MREYTGRHILIVRSIFDDLEKTVKAKGFKHPDFWDRE